MARRGRFTNPNSGGQNLSALIVSLLRERKSAEEQLLLDKFRNKEVSAEEVKAFYDNWASTSGYTEGTLEFDQLNQRKKNAHDTGIKYKYDDFLVEFNSTGGNNYAEFMDFLDGTAQTVNDRNSRQQYLDLRKSVTNNFITAASDKLANGQMDIEEFKSAVDAGIDGAFEKGTKEYYDARYSAFVAEYNGEYSKYQNRIKAGKSGAYSGFTSFVNQMKGRLSQYGIDKKSDLYGRLDADLVSVAAAGRTAGSNAQLDRVSKSSGILADLYAAALGTSGVPGLDLSGDAISGGKTYTIADLIGNPAGLQTWLRLIESGAADIPQGLRDKYDINSIDDIRLLIDQQTRVIATSTAAANTINPTQDNATWAALGTSLSRMVGSRTEVDEIADAMNQYSADISSAGAIGDDIGIVRATSEWKSFLLGLKSDYGKLDRVKLMADLKTYGVYGEQFTVGLRNTQRGLDGNLLTGGDQSLEDIFGIPAGYNANGPIEFGDTYADGSIQESLWNYHLLTTGQKVQVVTRDPVTGDVSKVTSDPVAAGPTGTLGSSGITSKNGGYLTVVTYVDGVDGTKVPVIQSLAPVTTIQQGNGSAQTPWGYKYVMYSGQEVWVAVNGTTYTAEPFAKKPGVLTNGVVFTDGQIASSVTAEVSPPTIDVNSIFSGPPKGYSELRLLAETLTKDLTTPGSPWAAALGPQDQARILGEIGVITAQADKIEITEVQTRIFRNGERGVNSETLSDKARLKDLRDGGSQGYNYNNFVLKNPDRYKETAQGVYELIRDNSVGPYGLQAGVDTLDPNGVRLPITVDIRLTADRQAANAQAYAGQPNPFSTGLGAIGFQGVGSGDFDFFRNKPVVSAAPSYLGANYNGGAPILPPTISPPSIAPAMTPFNAQDPEARRALIAAETTVPTPPAPIVGRRGGK